MPLVFGLSQKGRFFTKIVLSIATGYTIIALVGIVATLLRIYPFALQMPLVLICAIVSFYCRDKFEGSFDGYDWIVLGIGLLYILIFLAFFDRIIIWMGGDSVAHASMIRMLLDGDAVQIGIPPFGSYWDYYPKGFHFYSYLWARLFSILDVIQAIPVLITAVTPALLYSIARELAKKEDAVYAFTLASLVFPAHYSYLIWGGYPSAAAEMLLVGALLAVLVEKRILPIMLLGILFTHARLLVVVCSVLLGWLSMTRLRRNLPYILTGFATLIIVACAALSAHRPDLLISIVTSQELASKYAAQWYPAFLSLFGAVIALSRRDKLDRLAIAWAGAVAIMVILADIGPLKFVGSADRLLICLYLPFSLLAATALSKMAGSALKIKAGFVLILLLAGTVGMGAVLHS